MKHSTFAWQYRKGHDEGEGCSYTLIECELKLRQHNWKILTRHLYHYLLISGTFIQSELKLLYQCNLLKNPHLCRIATYQMLTLLLSFSTWLFCTQYKKIHKMLRWLVPLYWKICSIIHVCAMRSCYSLNNAI